MDKHPATTASRIATAFAGTILVLTLACSGGSPSGSGGWSPGGGGWHLGGGESSGFTTGSSSGDFGSSSGSGTSTSSGGFGSSSGVGSGTYVSGVPARSVGTMAGQVSGCGSGPGQCPCTDSRGELYCGSCPSNPLPCQYCPSGDYCPADLCNATTCPRSGSSCPSGYPNACGGGLCCPLGYSTCCADGVSCATDAASCPSSAGTSTSGGGSSTGGGTSCPSGVWSLAVSTPVTCQTCSAGARLNVTFTVTSQLAAGGGAFKDSDGVSWTYDPLTCTAAQASTCSAAGSVDFKNGSAVCYFFCAGACPGCAERCTLTQLQ